MNSHSALPNVSRKELAQRVAAQCKLPYLQVAPVVSSLFDAMIGFLSDGRSIQIRNFGTFNVLTHKSRIGRNPKRHDQTFAIPPKRTVRFKPGLVLKATCNAKP